MRNKENNIIDYLKEHALSSPNKTAFIIVENGEMTERKISYLELSMRVEKLAAHLTSEQLQGKRALLVYQDILEFIISFLAATWSGIIPVPVPYVKGTKQLARLLKIMEDAQVDTLLCTHYSIAHLKQGLSALPQSGKMEIIPTDTDHDQGALQSKRNRKAKRVHDKIAFIQYTSGSTGNPKGVVITAKNLLHNQQLIKDTFGCDGESVIFSWLPFHHDMGLIGNILHTIYIGCTCIIMPPFHFIQTPGKWLEAISTYKVTHSGGPNFAYDLCVNAIPRAEAAKLDLSTWKVAYNGSESVRADTIQRFASHFKSAGFRQNAFFPCYGLAEATLLVAGLKKTPAATTLFIDGEGTIDGKIIISAEGGPGAKPIVSSGGIAIGMECKIFSIAGPRECAELEEGEICIAGDSVTAGYWNKDNNAFFYDFGARRFMRTGDLGFLYDGELFVHGRLKEILIIRGRNFYPQDIEQIVSECDTAIETNGVAIFSIDNQEEKFVIVAEIKKTLIKGLSAENIISQIDNLVHGSLGISPYDIILTTPLGIPRTTSGKLQRVKCKDNYQDNAFTVIASKLGLAQKWVKKERNSLLATEVLRARDYNTIKGYLIDIIESKFSQLPIDPLNDRSDLTALGIDSLRAMELINAVNKDLAVNMDATTVFRDNTLSGLIHVIENLLWLKYEQPTGKEIII
jgi:acyl-CoA synthetase (AMP-forming)/AMP-acid ligase II/acyl carrier protein